MATRKTALQSFFIPIKTIAVKAIIAAKGMVVLNLVKLKLLRKLISITEINCQNNDVRYAPFELPQDRLRYNCSAITQDRVVETDMTKNGHKIA
jgi:hypothetical protein